MSCAFSISVMADEGPLDAAMPESKELNLIADIYPSCPR
jgi:hypothetical protein